jgi:hypothetical protein
VDCESISAIYLYNKRPDVREAAGIQPYSGMSLRCEAAAHLKLYRSHPQYTCPPSQCHLSIWHSICMQEAQGGVLHHKGCMTKMPERVTHEALGSRRIQHPNSNRDGFRGNMGRASSSLLQSRIKGVRR